MSDNILRLTDDLGNTKEYEILMTLKMEETNKNYVIYTDNAHENESLNIYANIYDPDDNTKLEPIETETEWELIDKILQKEYGEK